MANETEEKKSGEPQYIREVYGLDRERTKAILQSLDPVDFKSATDFVDKAMEVCETEAEKRYILAHMTSAYMETRQMVMTLELMLEVSRRLLMEAKERMEAKDEQEDTPKEKSKITTPVYIG